VHSYWIYVYQYPECAYAHRRYYKVLIKVTANSHILHLILRNYSFVSHPFLSELILYILPELIFHDMLRVNLHLLISLFFSLISSTNRTYYIDRKRIGIIFSFLLMIGSLEHRTKCETCSG